MKSIHRLMVALAGFLSCTAAVASMQAVPASVPADPMAIINDKLKMVTTALDKGRYLEGLDLLAAAAGDPALGGDSPLESFWAQLHPIVGGVVDPLTLGTGQPEPIEPQLASELAKAAPHDALAEIVKRARDTRIVILNEAHHSPRDRAFALRVAQALKPLGYDILAAETFSNDTSGGLNDPEIEQLARDGIPRLHHGMYLSDPVFGDFVRQALALGYRPVAYEAAMNVEAAKSSDPIAFREQAQTDALVERIFKRDPKARVLIYVGYSHAAEEPLGKSGRRWMAARLKEATGIDPLTIEQTTVSEFATSPTHREIYRLLKDRVEPDSVHFTVGGKPLKIGALGQSTDLQVVHPPQVLHNGRPSWLTWLGRRNVPVPKHLLPTKGRRLVQAFVASEPGDAIPLDQVVVTAGKPAPDLMLPDGPVRYAVQDPVG